MKKTTTFTVILTLAVVLGFVLVSVEQTQPAGPQWFGPTWPILKEGTAAPVKWQPAENPRFLIHDSGTPDDFTDDVVSDKETGIVWERSPDTTDRDWVTAIAHCYDSELANRKGSRLPTIEELASLLDEDEGPPTLPAGHPFINVQLGSYWSSTTDARLTSDAWAASFLRGVVRSPDKALPLFVWCVRGGHGHDAY
jgi:hypothetical protein